MHFVRLLPSAVSSIPPVTNLCPPWRLPSIIPMLAPRLSCADEALKACAGEAYSTRRIHARRNLSGWCLGRHWSGVRLAILLSLSEHAAPVVRAIIRKRVTPARACESNSAAT